MYYCQYPSFLEFLSGLNIDRVDKIYVSFAPNTSISVKAV